MWHSSQRYNKGEHDSPGLCKSWNKGRGNVVDRQNFANKQDDVFMLEETSIVQQDSLVNLIADTLDAEAIDTEGKIFAKPAKFFRR